MEDSMVALVVIPSAASGVRKVRIGVPRIEFLIDNQKYFLPGDLPPAEGEDLRALYRPAPGKFARSDKPARPAGRRPTSKAFEDELVRTLGQFQPADWGRYRAPLPSSVTSVATTGTQSPG